MNIKHYKKTIKSLESLIECLNTQDRKNYYDCITVIKTLMFDEDKLNQKFYIFLSNESIGSFTNMMWNISQTGFYYGSKINSYTVSAIIDCTKKVIDEVTVELNREEQLNTI